MITDGGLKSDEVVIAVKEEEVITTLFCSYHVRNEYGTNKEELKKSIAGFSHYIEYWLRDHYEIDD